MAERSSAGRRTGDSLVAKAIASSVAQPRRKQSRVGAIADAGQWAGGVVHRAARWRLLLLAEQERIAVRGSLLVVVQRRNADNDQLRARNPLQSSYARPGARWRPLLGDSNGAAPDGLLLRRLGRPG